MRMREFEAGLHLLPEHMRDGVKRYLERGIPLGGFGQAIFANNLVEAYGRADETNQACMRSWAEFLCNYAPIIGGHRSWGSADFVNKWCKLGGLAGIEAAMARKETTPTAGNLLKE